MPAISSFVSLRNCHNVFPTTRFTVICFAKYQSNPAALLRAQTAINRHLKISHAFCVPGRGKRDLGLPYLEQEQEKVLPRRRRSELRPGESAGIPSVIYSRKNRPIGKTAISAQQASAKSLTIRFAGMLYLRSQPFYGLGSSFLVPGPNEGRTWLFFP